MNTRIVRLLVHVLVGTAPLVGLVNGTYAQTVTVDFESLPVPAEGFFNGDTNGSSPYRDNFTITGTRENFGATEFLQLWETEGVSFFNGYTPDFQSWNGFSWSRIEDSVTPGFTNQYAAFPGGGSDGSGGVNPGENYVVSFSLDQSYINLPELARITSVEITNTTYAGISMRDGDGIGKKFGGPSGDDPDFFRLRLTGYSRLDREGTVTGNLDFYLADFRFDDHSQDYIIEAWTQVDLTGLGNARSIGLELETTDVGSFGPNTPLYLAMDNLSFSVIPEPGGSIVTALILGWLVARRRRVAQTTAKPSSTF